MSASKGFGAVSSMKTFTSRRTQHRVNWAKASQTGLSATTTPARILHSTIGHRDNSTLRKLHEHFALAAAFGRHRASPQTPRFSRHGGNSSMLPPWEKSGGGWRLPHGADIASLPLRLSLGKLLLSRARFRFSGTHTVHQTPSLQPDRKELPYHSATRDSIRITATWLRQRHHLLPPFMAAVFEICRAVRCPGRITTGAVSLLPKTAYAKRPHQLNCCLDSL